MAQPPTTPVKTPRLLVRNVPFAAQKVFNQSVVAAGLSLDITFDVAVATTDPNQFLVPTAASGLQPAVGPFLDAILQSSQVGTLNVVYFPDVGMAGLTVASIPINAVDPTNISGLRITGRLVKISFVNNGVVNATVDFAGYVRSA